MNIPESFITPAQAAAFLGTTEGTLEWRRATRVDCAPYWKGSDRPKSKVLYLLSELDAWRRGEWTGEICRVMGQPRAKATPKLAMPGIDIEGAATLLNQAIKMSTPLWSMPRMREAMRLLGRNPGLAAEVEEFILSHEGALTLGQPLNWSPAPPADKGKPGRKPKTAQTSP